MVTELQNKINNYIEFKDILMKFGLCYLDEYYKNIKRQNKLVNYLEDVDIILDDGYSHVISIYYTKQCPSYNNMTYKYQLRVNINEFEKWYEETFK